MTTVYNLPDDIILNTRRAHSTSATSANGYSSLGAPEGRYIARESSPNCVALIVGDCSAIGTSGSRARCSPAST